MSEKEFVPEDCSDIRIPDTDLIFTVCIGQQGFLIGHKGYAVIVDFKSFKDENRLREIIHETFGYKYKDPLNEKIAKTLQAKLHMIGSGDKIQGFFQTRSTGFATDDGKLITTARIKEMYDVKFAGVFDTNFDRKFVKILTYDNEMFVGDIKEVTDMIKTKHVVPNPDFLSAVFDQYLQTTTEYYSVGPWFDGNNFKFVTETPYNPPWRRITRYNIPKDVSDEEKKEVLNEFMYFVKAFGYKHVVTWILGFACVANFAHYIRQKIGHFPHLVIAGKSGTGKTTLTAYIKHIFWGRNPIPYGKPTNKEQLRYALAQSTLPIVIGEWNQLKRKNRTTTEMLDLLQWSTQNFVLKDENGGISLSLSSIIADINTIHFIDPMVVDRVIQINFREDMGYNLDRYEGRNPIFWYNFDTTYRFVNTLNAIGMELIERTAEKLKRFDFNRKMEVVFEELIFVGYTSWVDILKKYGISTDRFPTPEFETAIFDV